MDRRLFLTDLSRYAALAAVVPNVWRVTTRPRFADDPFQLGVASGDPTPTGGVLWTRLAPRPFEPDGGMDGLRAAIAQNRPVHELKELLDGDFINMREDGMRKVAEGITTVEEVLRATQDVEDFSEDLKKKKG